MKKICLKKGITMLLIPGLILSLASCKAEGNSGFGSGLGAPFREEGSTAAGSSGALTLLYHLQRGDTDCTTDAGYYYLSDNVERLTDGRNARHLMYIDFAAGQEIYLCSNAACSHNTADCTSVFLLEEFPQSSILFTWNGSLYLMSKEFDNDGSVMMGASGGESSAAESEPAVLYRMDLDGTNREKLYTFDPAVTVEDLAAADSGGLYFVTKKLSTEQNGGNAYRTASERNLIYLDSAGKKETVVCSMDFGDNISWDVVGCSGRSLILYGIDFGRSVSAEETHGDDGNKLYDSSYDVFAALNTDTCALTEIYRVYAPRARSYALDADRLYFSVSGEGRILSVNLQDGRQETLCSIQQDDIWGIVGDKLYTRDSRDRTYYFIDVNTGKISHSGLVEKTIGSSLDILAEAGDRVLAIYAIDAVPKGDGSYTVNGYRYGLIDKEDLYAGRDNFTAVKMIGNGR